MQSSARPAYLALITLLLLGILALGGCARLNRGRADLNPNGGQPPAAASPATPATGAGQPALTPLPDQPSTGQVEGDPELDAIDRLLGDVQNELNQTDTVGDFQ